VTTSAAGGGYDEKQLEERDGVLPLIGQASNREQQQTDKKFFVTIGRSGHSRETMG